MKPLYDRRKALYNEKRLKGIDDAGLNNIRVQCAAIAEELKPIRDELKLCKSIEERSKKVREAARMPLYAKEQGQRNKTVERHGQRNR